ncbi:putative glycoside hydrolase superfamily, glycoside hydrolase, family 3 domain superfamily [Plasmopara halstedii]
MATFTNVDLVGQMTEIAAYGLLNSTYQIDEEASPMSTVGKIDGKWGWTTAEMRAFVGRIQEIAMEENGGHPMIYGTDAAHAGPYTARDTLASGIPWIFDPFWTCSQPIVAPCVRDVWRGSASGFCHGCCITRGIQSYPEAAACMKHWIGYSWNQLATIERPAVDAGLLTGMENFVSVNGVPVVENTKLLTNYSVMI